MKREGTISRIITVVLGLFLFAYIGFQAYKALYNPVRTESAVYAEVDDSVRVDGYVIRDERVLSGSYGSGVLEMNMYEGERVANGSAVAVVYSDEAALERSHRAAELDEQIEMMTKLYSQSGESYDVDVANDRISEGAMKIAAIKQESISTTTEEDVENLKLQTMVREYMYRDKNELVTVIDSLKAERAKLDRGSSITKRFYAPATGYFSQNTDGLESTFTSEAVLGATPSQFEEMCGKFSQPSDSAIGKLIETNIWYYAALISEKEAERFAEGRELKLKFSDKALPEIECEVERISEPEGGKVLIIFKCNTYIGSFTKVRSATAQAVVKTYSGLKVPREALRVDESGQNGVYCLIDSQVKFKPIEIIFEKDSYYVAKYESSDTKSLLLYDEIVVSAKNLENKKIVK